MGRKNSGYIQKRKMEIEASYQAAKETYIQFMIDTISVTLNDPDIMGKDTFGKKRMKRILDGWSDMYDYFHKALERNAEADYYQEILDLKLKAIYGDEDFRSFAERYDWIRKPK